jgi:hypothetical protein
MSSSKSDFLRFPSNRSVEQVKKDARRFSKEQGVDLTTAQNILCKKNGLDMPFSKAITHLRVQLTYIKPEDNSADQQNKNKGTPGTNPRYDSVHGNRSKQLTRVVMLVEKGMFSDNDLETSKLERLSAKTAFKLGFFNQQDKGDKWLVESFDLIRFQKPIKGGTKNHSGAVLRIRSVIPRRHKMVLNFWVGNKKYDFPSPKEDCLSEWGGDDTHYNPYSSGD